jgi:DNA (cytosine-5)-methyltransferase 1
MTHGSLFSGIGGFDLAAEWMGWENIFHCEWNPFGQKILKYYWPKATSYNDITKTNFTIHRGTIDILTGGFPCQPYSIAGKQKGTSDERHLWPEMLRAIREVQPCYVVGENVPGLVNWSNGMVFEQVQTDLEAEGYEVTPFILPAAGVDAVHRRERIWFIAYSSGLQSERNRRYAKLGSEETKGQSKGHQWERLRNAVGNICSEVYDTDTNATGLSITQQTATIRKRRAEKGRATTEFHKPSNWLDFPTQSPVCNGDDGLPTKLDGITFPRWRNESIKGGGNAIVPQVALQIFQAIDQYEKLCG